VALLLVPIDIYLYSKLDILLWC